MYRRTGEWSKVENNHVYLTRARWVGHSHAFTELCIADEVLDFLSPVGAKTAHFSFP